MASENTNVGVYPDYYGGAYIDQQTGELVVLIVGDEEEQFAAQAQIASLTSEDESLRYQLCEVSYNKILSVIENVRENHAMLVAEGVVIDAVFDDILQGKVSVSVRNLNEDKEMLIRAVVNSDILCIENSETVDQEERVGAGYGITSLDNGGNSTLSFAAKRNGVKGFVIAGHAGDKENEEFVIAGTSTSIGKVTKTAYYNGTTADAAFVTAGSGVTPSYIMKTGDHIYDVGTDELAVNTAIVVYGAATGDESFDTIKSTAGFIYYPEDNCMINRCWRASYTSQAGDSGAPVMVNTGEYDSCIQYRLYGVHNGASGSYKYITPYSRIVDELNISCITS